jgi:hypothetical protein
MFVAGWEKDLAVCRAVLTRGMELANAILSVPEPAAQLQLANSARLALLSALRLVEKGQTSLASGSLVVDLAADYDLTQQKVAALVSRLSDLNAGGAAG